MLTWRSPMPDLKPIKIKPERPTCPVCQRKFKPKSTHQKHCTRACTIRAADRRRHGKPICTPGYKVNPRQPVTNELEAIKRWLTYARTKALRYGLENVAMEIDNALERWSMSERCSMCRVTILPGTGRYRVVDSGAICTKCHSSPQPSPQSQPPPDPAPDPPPPTDP